MVHERVHGTLFKAFSLPQTASLQKFASAPAPQLRAQARKFNTWSMVHRYMVHERVHEQTHSQCVCPGENPSLLPTSERFGKSRSVPFGFCKPDSVHPFGLCGHLSHAIACPAQGGVQLIPGGVQAGRRPSPCSSCIARGLPCPRRCLRGGGLLPHLFTLTREARAVYFLWRFPSRRDSSRRSPAFARRVAL